MPLTCSITKYNIWKYCHIVPHPSYPSSSVEILSEAQMKEHWTLSKKWGVWHVAQLYDFSLGQSPISITSGFLFFNSHFTIILSKTHKVFACDQQCSSTSHVLIHFHLYNILWIKYYLVLSGIIHILHMKKLRY